MIKPILASQILAMTGTEENYTIEANGPLWHCLGEMTIPRGMYEGEITLRSIEGYFLSAVRTLHLPSELQRRINLSVTEAIGIICQAQFSFEPAVPIQVRVFTHFLAGTQTGSHPSESQPDGIQPDPVLEAIDNTPEVTTTTHSKDGGWGYFLIERFIENLDSSSDEELHLIEIFLYKEG